MNLNHLVALLPPHCCYPQEEPIAKRRPPPSFGGKTAPPSPADDAAGKTGTGFSGSGNGMQGFQRLDGGWHFSLFVERVVGVSGTNDVVEDWNSKQFAGLKEALGHRAVFSAGVDTVGRVIVAKDDREGTGHDGGLEHLAKRQRAGCGRSGCRNVEAADRVSAVQEERCEMFGNIVGKDGAD